MVTLIFLKGLCGYVGLCFNILTLAPSKGVVEKTEQIAHTATDKRPLHSDFQHCLLGFDPSSLYFS